MRARTADPARLGLFWFGIQVVWGALLGVSLQARASEVASGWSLSAYAMLAAWGAGAAAITQIAAGYASDRLRERGSRRTKFYAAGTVAACAGLFWFYNAPAFASLFAAVLLVQVGMNVAIGPYQAVIPDAVGDEAMGTASSWMAGLQSLGNAAGAVLAGLVANAQAVAAGIAIALAGTAAVTIVHVRTLTPQLPVRREQIRITRAFADLFVSRALIYLGFYTLIGYLFFYLRSTLGPANAKADTGYTLLIVTAAGAVGALVAAKPADRLDRRALATIGGAIFVACIGVLIAAHAWIAIMCAAGVAGAAWGVFLTADWALGCRLIPRGHAATAMGIWNLALLIPQVLAPVIASIAISSLHANVIRAPRVSFAAAIVELLLGISWLWRLPGPQAVRSEQPGNTP